MVVQHFASEQENQFFYEIEALLNTNAFERLVLSKYQGEEEHLEKISFRIIEIQQRIMISSVYRYQTQDVTKNYTVDDAIFQIKQLLPHAKQANLWSNKNEWQLKRAKKKVILTQAKTQQGRVLSNTNHDREKQRYIDQQQDYLIDLGVTDQQHKVIPSMAKKWKQINKFIEIFSGALDHINMKDEQLHVVDFGSGKGYLTFAMYNYLNKNGWNPHLTGVELRDNLVNFCQKVADKNAFNSLDFFQGDVRSYSPEHLDVMIALHACDIATDFAIHCGIRLNASMIMCAPCCHKELRPQLRAPEVLQPMLQYGIHQGQQAEMLTDTIRALLLNAYGYETKVFEFVALEHTSKNKMILAVKKQSDDVVPNQEIIKQIQELKEMYGIQNHSLERLLADEQVDRQREGCRC